MADHCIGIVGGLGPYAGLDLVRKIFDNTLASHDQDHLRVMLHSFPSDIPVRPEFLLGLTDVNPGWAIGKVMQGLVAAGADYLAMPCNTAHSPAILEVALKQIDLNQVTFVHIIDTAIAQVLRCSRSKARVGLMATVATLKTELYQKALLKADRIPVVLDQKDCVEVQDAISNDVYGIKAQSNPVSERAYQILEQAALKLVQKDIEVLLLGCTEIPLALTKDNYFGVPCLDATKVLARELVKRIAPEKLKP